MQAFPHGRESDRRWSPTVGAVIAVGALLLAPVGSWEAQSWWPEWASRLWALNAIGVDKVVHAALFALLAWALMRSPLGAARHAALWVLSLATLYGAVLELAQVAIPGRSGDVFDLAADVVGAAIVVVIAFRTV